MLLLHIQEIVLGKSSEAPAAGSFVSWGGLLRILVLDTQKIVHEEAQEGSFCGMHRRDLALQRRSPPGRPLSGAREKRSKQQTISQTTSYACVFEPTDADLCTERSSKLVLGLRVPLYSTQNLPSSTSWCRCFPASISLVTSCRPSRVLHSGVRHVHTMSKHCGCAFGRDSSCASLVSKPLLPPWWKKSTAGCLL